MLPAPCSIHDDRLRELETEQASHAAQLRAGAEMFSTIQENIKLIHKHLSESTDRVEKTCSSIREDVRGLTSQVADMRVEQATQKVELTNIKREDRPFELIKKLKPYAMGATIAGAMAAGAAGGMPAVKAFVKMFTGE